MLYTENWITLIVTIEKDFIVERLKNDRVDEEFPLSHKSGKL